jgi:ABC-type uncharacterized transport system permease subunit
MKKQDINETLEKGGFDIIEDVELLEKVEDIIKVMGGELSPEGLNDLIMAIAIATYVGENIEW